VAIAIGATHRRAPARAFEDCTTTVWPPFRGKAESISAAHRSAVVGP
jgi:hypothetical protein